MIITDWPIFLYIEGSRDLDTLTLRDQHPIKVDDLLTMND